MTISTTVNKVVAPGDGAKFQFSFDPFVVQQPATGVDHDLVVYRVTSAGAVSTLTEGTGSTNYSVQVTSYPGTGQITYPATGSGFLPTGDYLVIKRKAPLLQATKLDNRGGYFPAVQENTFDRLVMMIQDLQEQIDRCVQITVNDDNVVGADPDLPNMIAQNYIRVNATGDGLEMGGFETTTASASSATPQNVTSGAGAAGASGDFSRADHVHSIGTAADVLADTTPQLGGNLDANGFNILIDGANFIGDESGNEQIVFTTTASAINHLGVTNAAAGSGPTVASVGTETDIDLTLSPKGAGDLILDVLKWPQADGSAGHIMVTDGAGQLSFQSHVGVEYTQTTTDATVTTVATGAIPVDKAVMVHVEGVARCTDTSAEAMGFELHNAVLNDGGTTTAGTQVKNEIDVGGALAWAVNIIANDTTDSWEVTVTGAAATTINWAFTVSVETV